MTETYDLFQQGRAQLEEGTRPGNRLAREGEAARARQGSIREALGIAYFRSSATAEAEAEFRAMLELRRPTTTRTTRSAVPREAGQGRRGERPLQARRRCGRTARLRLAHPRPRLGEGGRPARRSARVLVAGQDVGEIGPGFASCCSGPARRRRGRRPKRRLARKVARLRIFENEEGKFDRSSRRHRRRRARGQPVHADRGHLEGQPCRASRTRRVRSRRSRSTKVFCAALREHGIEVETGVFGARCGSSSRTTARSRSSSSVRHKRRRALVRALLSLKSPPHTRAV